MRWRSKAVHDWGGVHLRIQRKVWHEAALGVPWYGWVNENVYDPEGNFLKLTATDDEIAEAISRFIEKELQAEAAEDARRIYSRRHFRSNNAAVHRDASDYAP